MPERMDERLRRLLLIVPFVIAHPGVAVDEVCEKFGINRASLLRDLDLLLMCGLPGYSPGDLIEAWIDGDQVVIRMADYLSRPLRLTSAEALSLYAAARALHASGVEDPALARAIERLKEALGPEAASRVTVDIDQARDVATIQMAIDMKRRIHISHRSQAREELTERDVDPWGLMLATGRWYLVGWCHNVNDERIFRVDRIKEVTVLDKPAEITQEVDRAKYETAYVGSKDATEVLLELSPKASWVLDQYPPMKAPEPVGEGWVRATLSTGGTAWVERLLLRLGPHARVISPKSLEAAVRERACKLLERYGGASRS